MREMELTGMDSSASPGGRAQQSAVEGEGGGAGVAAGGGGGRAARAGVDGVVSGAGVSASGLSQRRAGREAAAAE